MKICASLINGFSLALSLSSFIWKNNTSNKNKSGHRVDSSNIQFAERSDVVESQFIENSVGQNVAQR